jgi:UDP-glucose 6-dehydrogenase
MCFPKDIAAFIAFAKSIGIKPKLLEAVREVNRDVAIYDSRENA